MADSSVAITEGSGTNIDTRTETDGGQHRQVIVIGDPATTAGVAPVDGTAGIKVDLGADNDVTVSGTITATPSGVQEIEGDEAESSGSLPNPILIGGDDGTDITNIAVNTSGQVQVDIADSAVDLMLGTDFSNVLGTSSLITATQADGLVNTTDTVNVSAFLYGFDGTVWDRIASIDNGGGNALKVSVSSNDGTGIQGTNNAGDNVGGLSTLAISSFGMLWDGAAWDRMRGDATDGLLVNLGSNNDISGTVTANLSATDNAVLDSIDTSLNNIEAGYAADGSAYGSGVLVQGDDGTDRRALKVDTSGRLDVSAISSIADDSTFTPGSTQVFPVGGMFDDVTPDSVNEGDVGIFRMSGRREMYTQIRDAAGNERGANVDASNRLTVLADLGSTDNAVLDAIAASLSVVDDWDDANYANVNLNITGTDVSTTNPVPTKGVPSDIDINGSNANHAQKYYTNAGAVTDGIIWSPAAGTRWHILTLYINVSAAATVTLEDDLAAGDSVVWKGELAANSGVILTYDKEHPFSSGEDAADLLITTSAGNVYVQAVGYEV